MPQHVVEEERKHFFAHLGYDRHILFDALFSQSRLFKRPTLGSRKVRTFSFISIGKSLHKKNVRIIFLWFKGGQHKGDKSSGSPFWGGFSSPGRESCDTAASRGGYLLEELLGVCPINWFKVIEAAPSFSHLQPSSAVGLFSGRIAKSHLRVLQRDSS